MACHISRSCCSVPVAPLQPDFPPGPLKQPAAPMNARSIRRERMQPAENFLLGAFNRFIGSPVHRVIALSLTLYVAPQKTKDVAIATSLYHISIFKYSITKLPNYKFLSVAEDLFLLLNGWRCRSDGGQRNESAFRLGLFQDVLAIEFLHACILSVALEFLIAGAQLLFTRGLGDAQVVQGGVASGVDVLFIQLQLVAAVRQANFLAAGKDLVASMLVVPLGEGRGHVHFLDDVAPAHAGVIGAEADFAFLRRIGNNALLGAAEIVVVKILEPH